ncbi:MAG: MFS transporter [Legionellaceae bacterium]|nr:MFS transporter [Legionellaceae bacterium]
MPQPLINITHKQAVTFAVFLVLYEFLTYIANDMIMPGMIQVVHSFHASQLNIATSLTLYVLGGASLQLILGPISDRYGRRPVMLFGACLFFLCTALIAFTHTINQFLVMRFFEGMGLCFISVIGYAVLQEIFAEMDAVRLIAIMTNVAVLAPLLGPLIGALLIHYLSWHYIFLIIAALSLVALWGLWRYMPESVGQIKRDGEEIKRTVLSFSVIYDNYTKLLFDLPFILGAISFGILGIVCVAWIGLSPIVLVTEAKLTLVEYGIWQIPIFGVFILANFVLVRLTRVMSLKQLSLLGGLISFLGLILVSLLPLIFDDHYFWLIPGVVVYFFGYGILASPFWRLILFATKVSKGTASALLSMVYMCVQGIGIEIANYVYASHNNYYFGYYSTGVGIVFLVLFVPSICLHQKVSPGISKNMAKQ